MKNIIKILIVSFIAYWLPHWAYSDTQKVYLDDLTPVKADVGWGQLWTCSQYCAKFNFPNFMLCSYPNGPTYDHGIDACADSDVIYDVPYNAKEFYFTPGLEMHNYEDGLYLDSYFEFHLYFDDDQIFSAVENQPTTCLGERHFDLGTAAQIELKTVWDTTIDRGHTVWANAYFTVENPNPQYNGWMYFYPEDTHWVWDNGNQTWLYFWGGWFYDFEATQKFWIK